MSIKKTNKDELLETTAKLFMAKGYHNTSISDIANACNLRKASIYHYVASKQDLALEVISTTRQAFNDNLFKIAKNSQIAEVDRFNAFFDSILHIYRDPSKGCLMGTLGLEVSGVVPELEIAVRGFFDDCINTLARLFAHFIDITTAKAVAEEVVAQIQGAIMLAKIYGDATLLQRVKIQTAKRLGIIKVTKPWENNLPHVDHQEIASEI